MSPEARHVLMTLFRADLERTHYGAIKDPAPPSRSVRHLARDLSKTNAARTRAERRDARLMRVRVMARLRQRGWLLKEIAPVWSVSVCTVSAELRGV